METTSSPSDPTSPETLADALAQVTVSSSSSSSSVSAPVAVLSAEDEAARAYQKMMAKEEHYRTYWAKKRAIGREKQKEKKRIAREIKEKELKEKGESEGLSLSQDHQQRQEESGDETSSTLDSGSSVQLVGKPKPTQRGKRKRMEKRGFLLESFVHNRPEIVIDLSFIDPLRLPQPPSSLTPVTLSSNDAPGPTLHSAKDESESQKEKEKRSFLSIKDIRHVIRQVHHCYGYLRKVEKPLPIHLTSLNDRLLPYFQKYDGFETWLFVRHNESYSKVFESSRIVYLTPDSPHPLLEFEEDSVYVIGGLDDHNKQANATLDKASSEGIRTARLPLTEFCPDRIANKSLTINQGLCPFPSSSFVVI